MKKLAIILFLLAIILSVTACNPKTDEPVEPEEFAYIGEWKVTVVTSDGDKEFTSADAAKLTFVTLDATTTNKNGEETTYKYTGVKLSDVLSHAGVTDFSSLIIEASDDFAAEYRKELALRGDTILSWERDGELFKDEQPVRAAPTSSGSSNDYVKNTKRIIVIYE
jgi:hypothetical protein